MRFLWWGKSHQERDLEEDNDRLKKQVSELLDAPSERHRVALWYLLSRLDRVAGPGDSAYYELHNLYAHLSIIPDAMKAHKALHETVQGDALFALERVLTGEPLPDSILDPKNAGR